MGKLKLTDEDRAWASEIRKIFDNKCCVCGAGPKYLNAHHLLPRERKDTKYDLRNGVLLCVKHHMFCRIISAHNNPIAFALWMEEHRPEQLQYARDKVRQLAEGSIGASG